jgi:hypothetical protein
MLMPVAARVLAVCAVVFFFAVNNCGSGVSLAQIGCGFV